jgi:hypothetical protein
VALILAVHDEPGSPVVVVTVDTGRLSTVTVSVPRAIYDTPAMQDVLDLAVANVRAPDDVRYASNRSQRGKS